METLEGKLIPARSVLSITKLTFSNVSESWKISLYTNDEFT
jgi:hypothetical protein